MIFICYPKCTTCRKARAWLDEHHITYNFRDIKLENPTYDVLPDDHVCNKGEIVRALNCAVEVLSRRKKKPLPENNGKPWTEELDRELSHLFDGGMKKQDLCEHFGRTSGAIESRLERLGKM